MHSSSNKPALTGGEGDNWAADRKSRRPGPVRMELTRLVYALCMADWAIPV